jgi:hypothetical protein
MLGLAIGLGAAVASLGLSALGLGVGLLLSDASVKHDVRRLSR